MSSIVYFFPNAIIGERSKEVIQISKDIDLSLGFTTKYKKTQLPIDFSDGNNMKLGRFDFYNCIDKKDLLLRCKVFRSRIAFSNLIINISKQLKSLEMLELTRCK